MEEKARSLLLHLEHDGLSKKAGQTAILGLEGGEELLAAFDNTDEVLSGDSRKIVVATTIGTVEVPVEVERVTVVWTMHD